MKLRLVPLLCAFAMLIATHARAQLIIIANPGIHATGIAKDDLRDVFTGVASTLKGSGSVSPVLLKAGPIHDEFLSTLIGKSDTAFRAGWRNFVFTGQGVMPRTFDSEAAVVEYVARTSGAIAYISKSTPHEGVKTLLVR